MLSHPSIQISYFAAGIVSHLACLKDEEWLAANQYHKSGFIKVLGTAVRNWSPPQTEMVAYRSFQPFQSLILHEESRLEIHLWAVWAIHHILTKKGTLSPDYLLATSFFHWHCLTACFHCFAESN
ncbi:unnamed protein product [Schistocephalus solidus]|uniref:Rab-GAP TBC domain-containing protein n=1 Tax=Schistocephalus solidus TaxID=70667 RepID=A0A183TTG8_SCHSO|nr:unnamed protein product [Schistocephalus solidus]